MPYRGCKEVYVFLIYNIIKDPQWYAVQVSPDKNRD